MDGVELNMLSLEDDIATFEVVELLDTFTSWIEMYFEDGLAIGYPTELSHENFDKRLYSISPSIGSAGGTKLTLSTAAIGVNTNLDGYKL